MQTLEIERDWLGILNPSVRANDLGKRILAVHFVSSPPVPIVTTQGLTAPDQVRDLRNGHLVANLPPASKNVSRTSLHFRMLLRSTNSRRVRDSPSIPSSALA